MTEPKKRKAGIFGKTVAFLFLLFGLICVPVGVYGTYYMIQEGFYLADNNELRHQIIEADVSEFAKEILYRFVKNTKSYADSSAVEYGCQYVVKQNGVVIGGNVTGDRAVIWSGSFTYNDYTAGRYRFSEIENYEITIYLLKRIIPDDISWIIFIADNSSTLRVVLPIMTAIGLIMVIGGYVWLLCHAGGWDEEGNPTAGLFGKIPADLFTIIICLIGYGWFHLIGEFFALENMLLMIVRVAGYLSLFIIWSMSIAARSKAKTLWTGMIIFRLWKIIKKFGNVVLCLVAKLPIIWKTICGILFFTILEFMVLLIIYRVRPMSGHMFTVLLVLWGIEKLLVVPFVCMAALRLKELQKAGYELAEGNLEYVVDTQKLFWDLKEHGKNLNRISEGVNKAVKERMKSEHFKTELITNVSHDIKTPLTSIINYSDLLCNEETDNEKIKEYADVLHRQSTRLKKLIEDLVEASKASTGAIEVALEVCEVGVLLEQAQGEFEGRLYEKNMDVITKLPEKPVKILADGKLLWRVFDNLFNNICKYAQSGTRVYITVENTEGKAIITFKNISEYPLDITADELMERFVRGDKSRHTEGNGLGLNIAKSLTELQNGTLELIIDGDLFKVILTFPTVE